MIVMTASGQTAGTPGSAVGESLKRAERAFDADQYAEAARLFEAAHERDPACNISFYSGLARYLSLS